LTRCEGSGSACAWGQFYESVFTAVIYQQKLLLVKLSFTIKACCAF
jgi:hypothetical protein